MMNPNMKSALKIKRRRKKRVKSREKTSIFFCLGAFTGGEKISLIKFAYFIQPFEKSY